MLDCFGEANHSMLFDVWCGGAIWDASTYQHWSKRAFHMLISNMALLPSNHWDELALAEVSMLPDIDLRIILQCHSRHV